MSEVRSATTEQATFLDELVESGLLIRTGVVGVYGRGAQFEQVRVAFDALVTRVAAEAPEEPELLCFPPIFPRHELETNGYLGSFPHLAGTVWGFDGDEQQAAQQLDCACRHEDWSQFQSMTDLVLTPAACYPIYPAVARRGPLPAGGITCDTSDAYVFRKEPSHEPSRMQIFHQRELVRIAEPELVLAWRREWRDRAAELLGSLELDIEVEVATDPFFGRVGRLLAAQQRDQDQKWELIADIAGKPTAVASFNYHEDHFSSVYDLRTESGEQAHTACLGLGEERVALALFSQHGLDTRLWPSSVRDRLGL